MPCRNRKAHRSPAAKIVIPSRLGAQIGMFLLNRDNGGRVDGIGDDSGLRQAPRAIIARAHKTNFTGLNEAAHRRQNFRRRGRCGNRREHNRDQWYRSAFVASFFALLRDLFLTQALLRAGITGQPFISEPDFTGDEKFVAVAAFVHPTSEQEFALAAVTAGDPEGVTIRCIQKRASRLDVGSRRSYARGGSGAIVPKYIVPRQRALISIFVFPSDTVFICLSFWRGDKGLCFRIKAGGCWSVLKSSSSASVVECLNL